MPRRKASKILAIALALATAGGVVALAMHHGRADAQKTQRPPKLDTGRKKTYVELAAANYKILKPTQTARLLGYADAAYSCMSKRLDLGRPRPLGTKIVMTLPPGARPRAVAALGASCAISIGDPPSDSSFQIRGHTVILYLPKYCILDKKIVALNHGVPDKGRASSDRRSE